MTSDASGAGTWQEASSGGAFWSLTGNSGTTAGTNFVGTTDDEPLELHVFGLRALRIEPDPISPRIIGGYYGNSGNVVGATIGGGGSSGAINQVTANYGSVGGGANNTASGVNATVSGGTGNTASGPDAAVGGGSGNTSGFLASTVGGGSSNQASGETSTVSGGIGNSATAIDSTVGGGFSNVASASAATVSGGEANYATGDYGTVGGGLDNDAEAEYATVAGGYSNEAKQPYATIGGGENNYAYDAYQVIAGGSGNEADWGADRATISGGSDNYATAPCQVISGGCGNKAGGGDRGADDGCGAAIGGGVSNTAEGSYSVIAGGFGNVASGSYSFAVGHRANAAHDGTVVFADDNDAEIASSGPGQFIVRANGGIWFGDVTTDHTIKMVPGSLISTSAGACLTRGGTWMNASDAALKENHVPVDGRQVLKRLAATPITTWNYISEGSEVRHMGPVAQDFSSAFDLGSDDKHIATVDADGVAFAAIQGLNEIVKEKDAQIADLAARLERIEAILASQANAHNGGAR